MTLPNELHPGFFSAGGGDVGDTIEQSLRFVDTSSPRLTRTFSQNHSSNSSTVSYWLKRGKLGTLQTVGCMDNGQNELFGRFNTSDQYVVVASSGGHTTTRVFRDPSAWYHIFINQTTLYINGVLEHTGTLINGITSKDKWNIGQYGANLTQYFDGYIADFHFVDGTNKAHTDFGKLNEDGVWVPQNYTGSYGTNGFHLTFDSSQTNGIGHDSSGNNNHFTASGFDTADARVYSKDLYSMTTGSGNWSTTTSKNWSSNTPPTGFNGNLSNAVQVTTGDTWVWRPSYPLTATLVEVYPTNSSPNQKLYFNGTEVGGSYTGAAWNTVHTGSATTVNHIGGEFTGGGNGFYGIRVNGTVLVDNTDNDVDYLDTPTSNYATWNPLSALAANVSFTDANLRLGTTASQAWTPGYLTFGPFECGKPGKYYFEMNDDDGTGYKTCNFGVTDNLSISWSDWWWNTGDTLSWYPETGAAYRNGGSSFSFGTNSTSGGKAMAIDFEAGTINAYSGGTLVGSLTGSSSNLTVGKKYYIVAATSNSNSTTMPFNFGQMPFIYTVPTGYKALQTNNLPEPTIKNGKDHFDVLTWTGDGDSGRSISGLGFQPDLVWIKCKNRLLNHNLYDSVRGVTKHLTPNENYGQSTTADSLTAFNEDGFAVGPGASDNTLSPASTYTAWCWKAAGSTTVLNQSGTIDSQVSANTDAGFSIISFTGNVTVSSSVGHGLTQAPEFVITKKLDNAGNFNTFHAAAGSTKYLALNLPDMAFNDSGMYNGTTSTVVNIGGYDAINASGEGMIMYAWHSVENYSKFGGYTGNGNGTSPNSDGPYIPLGFKPALVIIKRTDTSSGGEWSIYDSTRSPTNPNRAVLSANTTMIETTMDGLDLLSNGFKVRGAAGTWVNVSGGTYVYAAWAESPFGGKNVPPATGR